MGFTIYYRSTKQLDETASAAVKGRASQLCDGRSWLSCEPVGFWASEDGHLEGGSKPNFMSQLDPEELAEAEGMPDGNAMDMLDILCTLSQEFGIDWEISHDESDGTVGLIHDGVCDPEVKQRVEVFAQMSDNMGDFLGGMMDDFEM